MLFLRSPSKASKMEGIFIPTRYLSVFSFPYRTNVCDHFSFEFLESFAFTQCVCIVAPNAVGMLAQSRRGAAAEVDPGFVGSNYLRTERSKTSQLFQSENCGNDMKRLSQKAWSSKSVLVRFDQTLVQILCKLEAKRRQERVDYMSSYQSLAQNKPSTKTSESFILLFD